MGCDIHLFKEYRSPDINNNKLITGEDNPYQTKYEPDFRLMKSSEKSKSVSQSEEYPIVIHLL